jgi:hypothetical protein
MENTLYLTFRGHMIAIFSYESQIKERWWGIHNAVSGNLTLSFLIAASGRQLPFFHAMQKTPQWVEML